MNRTLSRAWLIGRHHFVQEASKRSFLLVLFSLPLFLALTISVGLLGARMSEHSTTIGYVDSRAFLQDSMVASGERNVQFRSYESRGEAQAALDNGAIDAYYLLAPDFAVTRRAELVYQEAPPWEAQQAFNAIVRRARLAGRSPQLTERVLQGPSLTVRVISTGREYPAVGPPPVSDFLPIIAAAVIGFLVMTTSGYLMEVVVAEKENRTMEIVISSVSAGEMMLGKIIGALGIAILQIAVWALCFIGAVWLGDVLEIGWLQNLHPDWANMAKIFVVGAPVYLLMAALMTAIGATLVDSHDAQQAGPFYLLVLYIPFYFIVLIGNNPNGPAALALSYFPPTAITAYALRMLFATVPWWQIGVTSAIALVASLLMVWAAGKVLRLSMLRYGQRLRWRELWARERAPQEGPSGPRLAGRERRA